MDTKAEHLTNWVGLCRAGFESDLASELMAHAQSQGAVGYVQAKADQGLAVWHAQHPQSIQMPDWQQTIFTRQMFLAGPVLSLSTADRLAQIIPALEALPWFSEIWVECPDTNDGRALSTLCRQLNQLLLRKLDKRLRKRSPYVAHVLMTRTDQCWVGLSDRNTHCPHPNGFQRLKMPKAAPSRSTLKLDEALRLWADTQQLVLKPGMSAVDLGACPGGWTYQLVRRGLKVWAIDNGPMHESVMSTGLVTHLQADGFKFVPQVPVDLMVCDMVEKPSMVAKLVVKWLFKGWCHSAIVNLKLPMKKRHEAVMAAIAELESQVPTARWQAKQLYHDREEITWYVTVR